MSLSNINELRGIADTGNGVRIGALTTITEVAASPIIRDQYPVLAQAAMEVASPQLRNQGTIGGNLCQKPRCWYYRGEFHCLRKGGETCFAITGENQYHCILGGDGCYIVHPSDTAPALIALDAKVRIAGSNGTRSCPCRRLLHASRQRPEEGNYSGAGRDRYRDSSACAAKRLAQFLPEGEGAPFLGLCPRQRCSGPDHER